MEKNDTLDNEIKRKYETKTGKLNTLSKNQIDEPKQIHNFHQWVVNKTNITVLNAELYLNKDGK